MREHVIANKFCPTKECPRSQSCRIKIEEENKEEEELQSQQFLDSCLNLPAYVRLLNAEIAVPHWSFKQGQNEYSSNNNNYCSSSSSSSSSSPSIWILVLWPFKFNSFQKFLKKIFSL
jgi:hypothetical protein